MSRFYAAPRLVTPTRRRKHQKAEAQDAMTANDTREYIITTDGAVATPPAGQVSHYRTADGWRQKDDTGTASDVGGGDEYRLRHAQVTITNDAFKASPTTFPVLVPSPGAGKRLQLVTAHATFDTRGGAYTGISAVGAVFIAVGTQISSALHNMDPNPSKIEVSLVLGNAALTPVRFDPRVYYSTAASEHFAARGENQMGHDNYAMELWAFNDNDYTGGHADNEVIVDVWWFEVDA